MRKIRELAAIAVRIMPALASATSPAFGADNLLRVVRQLVPLPAASKQTRLNENNEDGMTDAYH